MREMDIEKRDEGLSKVTEQKQLVTELGSDSF